MEKIWNNTYNILSKMGIATLGAVIYKWLFFKNKNPFEKDLILNTIMILLIWQGNVQIDKMLNKRYAWVGNPKKRLILQIICCTLFTALALFIMMYILHQLRFGDGRIINRKMIETFIPSLGITYIILAVYICIQFFNALRNSMIEVEKYKNESTYAQLQNLKNQLNPHFLFNNLSVLSALVYKNQDKAVDFINELSKVYRYVLDSKNTELVTLKEELDFLAHYIYLLKIRFENSLFISVKILDDTEGGYVLPMCLQTLLENTIQHNEASQTKPLKVSIYTTDDTLVVENTLQPRSDKTNSTQTGLKNIELRYAFFTDQKVAILQTENVYKVAIPLLKK